MHSKNMKAGQTITISHMEFLDDDGTLYLPNLRYAACTDRYIAIGDGKDMEYWQPKFTYHGFRYAQITGYGEPLTKKISVPSAYIPILQPEAISDAQCPGKCDSEEWFRRKRRIYTAF